MSTGGHDSDDKGLDAGELFDSLDLDEMAVLDAIDQPGEGAPAAVPPPPGVPVGELPRGHVPQGAVPTGAVPGGVPMGVPTPPTPPPGVVPSGIPAGQIPMGTPPVPSRAVAAPPAAVPPGRDELMSELVDDIFDTGSIDDVFDTGGQSEATPAEPSYAAPAGNGHELDDEDAAYEAFEAQIAAAARVDEAPAPADEAPAPVDAGAWPSAPPRAVGAWPSHALSEASPATPADAVDAVHAGDSGGDDEAYGPATRDELDAVGAPPTESAFDAYDRHDDAGDDELDDGDAVEMLTSSDAIEDVGAFDEIVDDFAEDVAAEEDEVSSGSSGAPSAASEVAAAPLITPPPAELAGERYLADAAAYRSESGKLARSRRWAELATMTSNALAHAQWAALPEVRSSLLIELARLYEDRLGDRSAAERTFNQLAHEDPTNREALAYLDAVYRANENHRALHDLYAAAVERTWDPGERLDLTRQAVELATEALGDPALAIADWEHLWQLGETSDEVATALSEAYRKTGQWESLASFIEEMAEGLEGAAQRVHLREIAEICVSALRAPDKAAPIVEAIRTERPLDPLALLLTTRIAFQSRDFDQLAALSRLEGLREDIARDVRRVAADALWQAGERELAVDVYERLLEDDAEDRDALRAKETYFEESGNFTALCAYLEQRADREAAGSAERRELLERAATIAETSLGDLDHAIALWQRIIDDGHDKPGSWRKLVDLYEHMANMNGVARSLEGLLAQTAKPAARVEILARLGEIYSHHLGDDDRAEQNWRALLNLMPADTHAQAELAEIYARRGDFDALDQTLRRQVSSAGDDQVLDLVQAAARNVEEHIDDAARSAAAWEQVLDYAPDDGDSLTRLARRLDQLDRKRERLAALERRVHGSDTAERIEQCLELAEGWMALGGRSAAVATWERILRWDPTQPDALAALENLADDSERGATRTALELAANLAQDPDHRVNRLRRALDHVGPDDHGRRAAFLARLVGAGDLSALDELRECAGRTDQHEAVAAMLLRLASDADDDTARASRLRELASLYENQLGDAVRAYAATASIGFDAERHDADLDELTRLCRQTDRLEDLLAIHDGLATARFEPSRRRTALEARAELLSAEPARAFEELRRLLMLEPDNDAALSRAEAMAAEHGLDAQLATLYGELWDLASDAERRARVATKRHALVERTPDDALEQLLLRYRVEDGNELRDALIEAAGAQNAWSVVLPRIEAAERAQDTPSVESLCRIASLYEQHLSEADHALELLAEALTLDPSRSSTVDELVRVAGSVEQPARLAQALRMAAARAEDTSTALSLYRRVAEIYHDALDAKASAVDIHRRILRLQPDERTSIEALIEWHRDNASWAELRDVIGQRVACAADDEDVTELWMEVAAISRGHLDDAEGALDAYSRILAEQPEHEAARHGVNDLTGDSMSPEVQARRLRLELRLADAEARPELMLELAALQIGELKRADAAQKTLYELIEETGAAGPGFQPLADLLEQRESWRELTELLERHADALLGDVDATDETGTDDEAPTAAPSVEPDPERAAVALRRALSLCDEHDGTRDDAERIARKLRALEPDDRGLLDRLAQAMRATDRWEELAGLLQAAIDTSDDADERLELRRELARVLSLSLDRRDEARAVLDQVRRDEPENLAAICHIASLARDAGDIERYVEMRKAQAERVEPRLGSLIHCHLAEVYDEQDDATRVAVAYRAARALDRDNPVAGDALRALGRRNKNWRQTAALLTDENERELSWSQRSERLAELAAAAGDDHDAALDLLSRAIAVDPDNAAAWRALAEVHGVRGETDARVEAMLGAVSAFERRHAPSASRLVEHAGVLHDAASAARVVGDDFMATRLDLRAHALAPHFAPAALAVADARASEGDLETAFELYDQTIGQHAEHLDEETAAHAIFRRGALAARLGKVEQAIDDLRATVRSNPLHLAALDALAGLHESQGHPALALANLQQALVVAGDREARGRTCYRLGQLWEDGLGDADEAGPYYELALEYGAGDASLMKRALDHYRRDGRLDEALAMVQELTRDTSDPHTLATLWITRGEILEQREPDEAIEAFDMALSYEPGHVAALDGLERMMTAREDWAQLADLLEGRIDGAESKSEQAAALRRLADLCQEQLADFERANASLRRVLDLEPSAEVVNRLLENLGDGASEERRELLEYAIEAGGNRFDRAIELAMMHLDAGRRHQAWAILAPLRVVIHMEPELKDALNDLRQEFERAEPEGVLEHLHLARPEPAPLRDALFEAIGRLRDVTGPLGIASLDDVVKGAVSVSESTPNGKIFAQLRDALGVENAELWRATDLEEDIVVIDGEPAIVCLKTEIFQKASRGELYFWLALALEMAGGAARAATAQAPGQRDAFAPALLAALGLGEAPSGAVALVDALNGRIDGADGLREELTAILEPVVEQQGTADAERFHAESQRVAQRVASMVVYDLRAAWRALSRMDETLPDQRAVKSLEDVNALFDDSETMGQLLRFAVSDEFGSWL